MSAAIAIRNQLAKASYPQISSALGQIETLVSDMRAVLAEHGADAHGDLVAMDDLASILANAPGPVGMGANIASIVLGLAASAVKPGQPLIEINHGPTHAIIGDAPGYYDGL